MARYDGMDQCHATVMAAWNRGIRHPLFYAAAAAGFVLATFWLPAWL